MPPAIQKTEKKTPLLFKRVLIANRGEIAVRIIHTLKEMGITAVALASEVDKASLFVKEADEVILLPGQSSAETYLNIERIIEKAVSNRIDAIHPGYGFLSENARFAQACLDANIVFIGPTPTNIDSLGDKVQAKKIMQTAGIPVIPGIEVSQNDLQENERQNNPSNVQELDALISAIEAIGYPIIIKACSGGGGRGMRKVNSRESLISQVESARRESEKAFGSRAIFIEKYIETPRHIEVQIMGDHHGNIVHLFERECSIQRRHQKVIEESPAVNLSESLRKKITETAVAVASTVGYTNAGTVEFILAPNDDFYFLEMNTRLQVEHPVTEWVTGLDLVRMQIEIACGYPLELTQDKIQTHGHAIECRLCAENPTQNFFPVTGKLDIFRMPQLPFVRIDSGVVEGDTVSTHYDSMLSKFTVFSTSRPLAIAKMQHTLMQTVILGLATNQSFLSAIFNHPRFLKGEIHTHFIEEELETLLSAMANSETRPSLDSFTDTKLSDLQELDNELDALAVSGALYHLLSQESLSSQNPVNPLQQPLKINPWQQAHSEVFQP